MADERKRSDYGILDQRVTTLEETQEKITERLQHGEVLFVGIQKDVEQLTKSVTELSETIKGAVRWVISIVGSTAVGAIIWVIIQRGHQ